jgi:NADPH:quinone reductase-like Zn-dependent oxidoreductase
MAAKYGFAPRREPKLHPDCGLFASLSTFKQVDEEEVWYVDIPEPGAPGPDQVLIGVEFSPIMQAAAMIASGQVHIPVAATYPLSAIKDAVAHAQRGGKILLDVAGSST